MNTLPQMARPALPLLDSFEEAQAAYKARLNTLREAATEWGVRPRTPEGAFISAMIGSIAELGAMSLSIGARLEATVPIADGALEKRLRIADADVKALQVALHESAHLLSDAKQALTTTGTDRDQLIREAVATVSKDIIETLQRPLMIRTTNLNTERLWARYIVAGAVGIGVLLVGLVMGEVNAAKPGMTEMAIRACAADPVMDGHGHAYCDLRHLQAGLH